MLKDIFLHSITREIPPVIYFHEQDPKQLAAEVSEYIITGGWPKEHPNHKRVPNGIHEQYVRLLTRISEEMNGHPSLPSSWISGFYGSGKSSFAKLLGLALDGKTLPNGKTLAESLLARDTSPQRATFQKAWQALLQKVQPISVVFDVGGTAREGESIPSAILRQVQTRLHYSQIPYVAHYELRIERDGLWRDFTELCERELGLSWEEALKGQWVDEDFSRLMYKFRPKQYPHENAWLDTWGGKDIPHSSPEEIVKEISDMMAFRANQKTLFIVVDEVSQYIHNNEGRMLSLQSFVTSLGAKLRGQVWLLVTGQKKLEEAASSDVIGKLKDRFPEKLRVHLAPSNIRDVVHKRLLEKTPAARSELQQIFQKNRANLHLYAYNCTDISEDEFVDVYPMLPSQIDLLMSITTQMRARSDRTQSDAQAIRGLMQMLGELFRSQDLLQKPIGALIAIDHFYDLLSSSLSSDDQESLSRIFNQYAKDSNPLLQRVIKAVALLSMINEKEPTTPKLVAQCLFDRVDSEPLEDLVSSVLERLYKENVFGYSQKLGYHIHSSAAQEWQKERDERFVPAQQRSKTIQEALSGLNAKLKKPTCKGREVPWNTYYSDHDGFDEQSIHKTPDHTRFSLHFFFLSELDKAKRMQWIPLSKESNKTDQLLWVTTHTDKVETLAEKLVRSATMCNQYNARTDSLSHSQHQCLIQEKARLDELQKELSNALKEAWMQGSLYFRGREIRPNTKGDSFELVFTRTSEEILPEIFPNMLSFRIEKDKLAQLFQPNPTGISKYFLTKEHHGELGIFALEGKKYLPVCSGPIPDQIYKAIKRGSTGGSLLDDFAKPPYGYESNVVLACVAGLLHAEQIEIHDDNIPNPIQHFRDVGARDIFDQLRRFSKANILPSKENDLSRSDHTRICRFFEEQFQIEEVDREVGQIADTAGIHLPLLQQQLAEVKALLQSLPGKRVLPPALTHLEDALTSCIANIRHTRKIVLLLRKYLDKLIDGVPKLRAYHSEIKPEHIQQLQDAQFVLDTQIAQLRAIHALSEGNEEKVAEIQKLLQQERPWSEAHLLDSMLEPFQKLYQETRKDKLAEQQEEVNQATAELRKRQGFSELDPNDVHRVLKPINQARTMTTEQDFFPTLSELQGNFQIKLNAAKEEANRHLDSLLSKQSDIPILPMQLDLQNREIETQEQLDSLLQEIRERIQAQLKNKVRVRIL